jgi:glycosyltransferase involved in cell wall biosynthesis
MDDVRDDLERVGRPPLRIGLIAPPAVPVPPPVYGGTELVVDQLARGLQRAGCDVTLFASGDSTCPVRRRSIWPVAVGTVADPCVERAHVAAAYRAFDDVDVIHDHTITGPANTQLVPPGVAALTTVHGPFTPATRLLYHRASARMAIVAISEDQRRRAADVPIAAVIHHGIDVDAIPVGGGRGGYVLFLGRMSDEKGPDRAIRAARAAGWPIVLAAKMWEPAEERYFAERVEPLLGPDARYIGEVGGDEKLALIGAAAALVNPIRWPEPFGLVMIEALACGTPVVAFREGAAPEIVDDGRTGFLCDRDGDLIDALSQLGRLDRHACRADVRERFSTTRMVQAHLRLYRALLAGATTVPSTTTSAPHHRHLPPATHGHRTGTQQRDHPRSAVATR